MITDIDSGWNEICVEGRGYSVEVLRLRFFIVQSVSQFCGHGCCTVCL